MNQKKKKVWKKETSRKEVKDQSIPPENMKTSSTTPETVNNAETAETNQDTEDKTKES